MAKWQFKLRPLRRNHTVQKELLSELSIAGCPGMDMRDPTDIASSGWPIASTLRTRRT
jgi:hypothetical protein